jgi:general nucleoside transport system ATP-binding protein
MTSPSPPIIQMANISKRFPGGVVANDDVSLSVAEGTLHAVIGENGAGKSTLMNILYGRIQPDAGRIRMRGEDVKVDSPAKAIALGLGMVTQHTTLIPALSVLENVILGNEPGAAGIIDRKSAVASATKLADDLGVHVDWRAPAGLLSVPAQQKVEIIKALSRGTRILILDEPTATLAPQEAAALFGILHGLADSGTTVIFITHKLSEVMAHSSRVTVLRGGRSVGERATADTYPEELLAMMIGQRAAGPGVPLQGDILADETQPSSTEVPLPPYAVKPSDLPPVPTLEVRGITVLNDRRAPAVRSISLDVFPGEILGVAGVDGSGQRQLAEAIVGLRSLQSGSVILDGHEVSRLSVAARQRSGIAYIPEDRHREGLVLDFTIAENVLLGRERDHRFGGGSVLEIPRIAQVGDLAVHDHRIRAAGGNVLARTLSGGNQQKVVIARALLGQPRLLVAMQPTRGLDVEAARFVYEAIRTAQQNGLAILLFSLDLDEIMELSGRIAVMYNGELAGVVDRDSATVDNVGRLMVGADGRTGDARE